jgi:CRP/FNR family transcriptional regulator
MIAAQALRTNGSAGRSAGSVNVVSMKPPKRTRRRIHRGESLYGVGDPFRVLYVVRVGVFKSFTVSDDGLMQVTGFPMAGDLIGLDGFDTGVHQSEVVALEDAEVFVLPFAQCEQWSQDSIFGQRMMLRTMAHEIVRSQDLMIMLGTMRAEQRVALFLLDLSQRYGRLGYSQTQFLLRMTRQEIGSYLGLKLETVSRILSHFQQEGYLQVQGRSISLLDLPALGRLSGLSPDRSRVAPESILDREGEFAQDHNEVLRLRTTSRND